MTENHTVNDGGFEGHDDDEEKPGKKIEPEFADPKRLTPGEASVDMISKAMYKNPKGNLICDFQRLVAWWPRFGRTRFMEGLRELGFKSQGPGGEGIWIKTIPKPPAEITTTFKPKRQYFRTKQSGKTTREN